MKRVYEGIPSWYEFRWYRLAWSKGNRGGTQSDYDGHWRYLGAGYWWMTRRRRGPHVSGPTWSINEPDVLRLYVSGVDQPLEALELARAKVEETEERRLPILPRRQLVDLTVWPLAVAFFEVRATMAAVGSTITGMDTITPPRPRLLDEIQVQNFTGQWVPVTEALPPERFHVLVMLRGDTCPAYAWLKFAAGDRDCPFFVCPQGAAMEPRGCHINAPAHARNRADVTHWFTTGKSLPSKPAEHDQLPWGLGGSGWEPCAVG